MRWKQADFLAGMFVIAGFALILAIIVVVRARSARRTSIIPISRMLPGCVPGLPWSMRAISSAPSPE